MGSEAVRFFRRLTPAFSYQENADSGSKFVFLRLIETSGSLDVLLSDDEIRPLNFPAKGDSPEKAKSFVSANRSAVCGYHSLKSPSYSCVRLRCQQHRTRELLRLLLDNFKQSANPTCPNGRGNDPHRESPLPLRASIAAMRSLKSSVDSHEELL